MHLVIRHSTYKGQKILLLNEKYLASYFHIWKTNKIYCVLYKNQLSKWNISTLQNTKLIYSLNICGLCSKCFYNGVLKPKTLILRLTYLSYMGSKEVNEAICGVDFTIIAQTNPHYHILSNKEPNPFVIRSWSDILN